MGPVSEISFAAFALRSKMALQKGKRGISRPAGESAGANLRQLAKDGSVGRTYLVVRFRNCDRPGLPAAG
jgi:hypothetical protein